MKKVQPKEPSKRERQLLEALYRLGRGSAAEIQQAISNPPTYTAVRTHLSNLEDKGLVKVETDGTRYIYEPTEARGEVARSVVGDVLKTFFENRVDLLVATLIDREESNLTHEDLDRLANMIAKAREEER